MLSAFFVRDFINLMVEEEGRDQIFIPNNPMNIGLGFAWNNSVLSFAYDYGFDFMRDKEMGYTQALDFQYHYYSRKFVADFFYSKYKGFYMEDAKSTVDYEICPDLRIRQYGINGHYVFNNKRYSYKAAYNQSEKQLRSAGSFVVGGGIFYSNIESEGSFEYEGKNNMENFQIGLSGGYTYSWVLGKHWLLSGSATLGIGFGSESIRKFGCQLEVYPIVFPRFSATYNHDRWGLGFSFLGNITYSSLKDKSTVGLIAGSTKISFVYRIVDVPLLSRLIK